VLKHFPARYLYDKGNPRAISVAAADAHRLQPHAAESHMTTTRIVVYAHRPVDALRRPQLPTPGIIFRRDAVGAFPSLT
jgi:hypothetical protein